MLFHKKISTDKFSLLTVWQTENLSLAATTTAARAVTVAIVTAQHDQFVHGFHLLSYRYLSIDCFKKIGGSARLPSNLIG